MIILRGVKAALSVAFFLSSCTTTAFASELRGAKADPGRDLLLGSFLGTCREDRCGRGFLGVFGHKKKIHLRSDAGTCAELCTQFGVRKRVNHGEWVCGPCDVCKNDNSGPDTDTGCGTAEGGPVCVFDNDMEPLAGDFGDKCVPCINDNIGGMADTGCGGDKPFCVSSDGSPIDLDAIGGMCDECPTSQVSICFVVDESGSISSTEFNQLQAFLGGTGTATAPNPNGLIYDISTAVTDEEFSFVYFSTSVNSVTPAAAWHDTPSAQSDILGHAKATGETNHEAGIQACHDKTDEANNMYSTKMIITITDGQSNTGNPPANAAATAAADGNIMIAIGIGNGISDLTLKDIAAGDENNVYKATGFDGLDEILDEIIGAVCIG